MGNPRAFTELILLDTNVAKRLIDRESNVYHDIINIIININKQTQNTRYVVGIFKDELKNSEIEKVREKIAKSASILSSFAIEYVKISYAKQKQKIYRKCRIDIREIRKHFMANVDENCNQEIANDAFLLIYACSSLNDYGRVIIVTRDHEACERTKTAVSDLMMQDAVKVMCIDRGSGGKG